MSTRLIVATGRTQRSPNLPLRWMLHQNTLFFPFFLIAQVQPAFEPAVSTEGLESHGESITSFPDSSPLFGSCTWVT